MYWVMFVLLGLAFGYALRFPWSLIAFLIPLALMLVATDRSGGAMVIGIVVTAIGVVAGTALAAREDDRAAAT